MSMWMFIVLGTALGGALLVWHTVSQTKHVSEEMLDKYRHMLAEARRQKAEQLAKAESDDKDESSASK